MSREFKSSIIGLQLMALMSSIVTAIRNEQQKLQDSFANMLGEMPHHATQHQQFNRISKLSGKFGHSH